MSASRRFKLPLEFDLVRAHSISGLNPVSDVVPVEADRREPTLEIVLYTGLSELSYRKNAVLHITSNQ